MDRVKGHISRDMIRNTDVGLGGAIRQRRLAMQMSLSELSRQMGGSPGPSFLSRVESGELEPSRTLVRRLAEALELPFETLLNAAGHATAQQRADALAGLVEAAKRSSRISVALPVLDPDRPTAPLGALPKRRWTLRREEKAALVALTGASNEPFVGDVVVALEREPAEGAGVVAEVRGRLGAFTYRVVDGRVWLEDGNGQQIEDPERLLGVIIQVVRTMDYDV